MSAQGEALSSLFSPRLRVSAVQSLFASLCLLVTCGIAAHAQEKPKPEIKGSSLRVLHAGQKATFTLYGENLAPQAATASRPPLQVKLLNVKPTEGDAKQRGSRQVAVEAVAPADCPPDTYQIVLAQPDNTKLTVPVAVLAPANLLDAKKPNGTFAQAMPLPVPPVAVTGAVVGDAFAVFSFEARTGETWDVTLLAGRVGSDMDAVVRLCDRDRLCLALAAGHPKKDRHIRFRAPADGTFYIEVSDVDGRTGPAFTYQLVLRKTP